MNEISFKVEWDDRVGYAMNIYVDGQLLQNLIRRVEEPIVAARGMRPDRAGEYAGIVSLEWIQWPSRHFLGEPDPRLSWFEDGDAIILGCICGVADDRPFTAVIGVDSAVVTWTRFRLGGVPDWDLSALEPFQFDYARYVDSLRQATR